MASSGKKKTTMAKLARESRLRERRAAKAARKDARKLAALNGPELPDEAGTDEDSGGDIHANVEPGVEANL
jgi:hypothetical protein